ncbi:unnamed protein product [Thlaspi arvense]|uniref:NYN domain-containing protein n=1 Tax=Thlaspi arvense TaxID=13288 RepID=A0AAU9RBZ3_THLAR|nr:unnamed protein product [Thlaspi arvense]
MMEDLNTATANQAWAETTVWWDISRCPVPGDVDAGRVVPFIKRLLKKLGYTGPLTIIVIGILSEVPIYVLRAISSSGINLLEHIPTGTTYISDRLWGCAWLDQPESNVMLISSQFVFGQRLETIARDVNVIGPLCPSDHPSLGSPFRGCLPWDTVLESIRADSDGGDLECSGTATFNCVACTRADFSDFAVFAKHLHSDDHALEDLSSYRSMFKIPHSYFKKDISRIRRKLKRSRNCVADDEREREAEFNEERERKAMYCFK